MNAVSHNTILKFDILGLIVKGLKIFGQFCARPSWAIKGALVLGYIFIIGGFLNLLYGLKGVSLVLPGFLLSLNKIIHYMFFSKNIMSK